jgi:hypothetical protein
MLRRALLLLLAVCSGTSSYASSNSELQSKLAASTSHYTVTADNFIDAITHTAQAFQIPMGIVCVNSGPTHSKMNMQWDHASVQQILQSIVSTQPDYTMSEDGDIVHVACNQIPPDQNFLLLTIKTFEVHNAPVEMAERKLGNSIRATIEPPQSGRGGIGGSLFTQTGEPEISLRLDDVTVQKILDKLVEISNKKIWVVTFADTPVPTPTGLRRTVTLWNNAPIPDNSQPLWDMFGWKDSVPETKGPSNPNH